MGHDVSLLNAFVKKVIAFSLVVILTIYRNFFTILCSTFVK